MEWRTYVSTQKIPHWVEPLQLLLDFQAAFRRCRQLLKRMGEAAGVGIEPDSQTSLVDATEGLAGVISAGVPGAGGVDAVFAITLSESSRRNVETLWAGWSGSGGTRVCPLLLRADIGARAGVRVESLEY